MSTLNKTAFEALYGLSGTTFPDNTTGLISEGDMRQFGKDIADSFFNTPDDSYTKPFPQVTASGTDTYTATVSPSISAYATGQRFQVLFTNANTGAATLNINGLGAKAIVKNGSTALAANDINAGQILLLAYDGTNMQMIGGSNAVVSGFVESVTGDGVDNTDPANPVLTFPTASEVDNTPAGSIAATTVQGAINELDTEKAPLSSPALTGTPTAPTAAPGTNTTQIATTAFVGAAITAAAPAAASETVSGIAELATTAETTAGTDDVRIVTPLKLKNKYKAKSNNTTSFTVDSTNDQTNVISNPSGSINCTVNSAATDVMVNVINVGTGNISMVAGSGVTLTGITTLTPAKGAVVYYTSSTAAVVLGGSVISFSNITSKPTTLVGYGITDAQRFLYSTQTQVTTVTTTETTLATYTVPANTLSTNGGSLSGIFGGTLAATANNKTIRVKFGSTTIFDSGALAITTASDFTLRIFIVRVSATSEKAVTTLITSSAVLTSYADYSTASEDLTTSLALAVTGQGTANADLVGEFFEVTKGGA